MSATKFVTDEYPSTLDPVIIIEKESNFDYEIQRVGIMIRGEGFPANTDVSITILQVNNDEERYSTVVRSDVNGEVYHRYIGWLEHQQLNNLHRLTLSAEIDGAVFGDQVEFRAGPGGDGSFFYFNDREMSVTPSTLTHSDLSATGIHIESVDMDGRESTAELIINGKVVAEVPVTEIANQFGAVDYQYVDNTLQAGEHEAALRTVHVSGGVNPVTWERVAWDTFTVTEDPTPVEVTAQAPAREGNTVTIPVVDGVTYVDGDNAELSGTITLTEGEPLTVTATADDGYVLAEGTHEWVFEYEDDTPTPVEVTAQAPAREGNTVTIPVVDGVTYVDGDNAELSGTITLTEGEPLTVTATADDGYVLARSEERRVGKEC